MPHVIASAPARAALLLALVVAALLTAAPPRAEAVVGGRFATAADDPAMAGLVRRGQRAIDSLFCGASVIAPTAVVTAAHCLEGGLRASQVDVVAGAVRLTDPALQRAQVARVVVHPRYDSVRTVHDVAVLLLASPLAVAPVALATPAEAALGDPGALLLLTGWGEQRYNAPDTLPDALRAADIPVVANRVCAELFDVYDPALQLCGQAPRNRPDSCQGDSGGPLIAAPGLAPRLVGIVSYSADQCGSAGYAGVYVRVSAEQAWIAATAGLGAPAAPAPAEPAAPAVRRRVTARFGSIACDEDSCSVVVRVSGSGRRDVRSVVVRVRRPEQRGYSATSRYVKARKVAPGVYRARTLLPYGRIQLTGVAFDAAGVQLGPAARERIEVYDG